ncbi:hypothetical protein PENANT_c029G05446 [Penicillium antarcticum]|uniref:SnoaL-like domain-containing protein n=1 Tax=Penicillium antarcticum TaxID=416450 RepID=A0A1V6PXD7_9EURO|nr:uncharacterized protein N7508_001582 [Penicillium antarcticum]KAJ5317074.1 hypothetical protein N7508_001582 [Penicillium antarcticum]OQD81126.1 hypothetical protein PENANT_c029G05446 [Penicillium antarcticum]
MPELVSRVSAASVRNASWPETPAQQFFKKYVDTVDSYGFNHGSGLRFYSKDVIFHNQNNAQYNGGDEMWAWMKRLFGQFERLRHDFHGLWEINNEDGTTTIISQNTRNIWLPGNSTEEPTVSIPLSWISRIGPADLGDAVDGLHFKEVWLYWDTALLAQYLPKEAVVFQTQNVLHRQ